MRSLRSRRSCSLPPSCSPRPRGRPASCSLRSRRRCRSRSRARIALLAAAGAAAATAALAEGRRRGLERHALIDPLTGLYRAEFFSEALEVELRRVHRYGGEIALVILDLDDFKQVNDRHGHATGNEVLRGAGSVLRKAARDSDVAARFGGEELVLLVRGDERSATAAAAARRRGPARRCASPAACRSRARPASPRSPEGGDSASLFASADEALYEAKRRGKNRVVVSRSAPASRNAGGAPPSSQRSECSRIGAEASAAAKRLAVESRERPVAGLAPPGRGRTARRDATASRR